VARNIEAGRPGATRPEIEAAARAANADEFIRRLPEGYDTVLDQRGGSLSGGERQRIAIARAFLRNSPILILDEPTAALDSRSESELLEAMEHLMEGRATILITHRLSSLKKVTRIIVLRDGQIVETGRPEVLRTAGGLFERFHSLQVAGSGEPV
jgi:ATP-binding cassette subfamily B protein/subfamily B ATP-binding cassette protein MsbA